MSTLRVNTLQNAAGTGQPAMSGAAKAWVNFNGTGTVAIRASFNVTSITDNGTGDYTVNFTNALEDANFCGLVAFQSTNSTVTNTWNFIASANTTSSARIAYYASSAATDNAYVNVSVFR
jgi:hypothetical protein